MVEHRLWQSSLLMRNDLLPLLAIRPSTQYPKHPQCCQYSQHDAQELFKRKRMLLLVFAHHPLCHFLRAISAPWFVRERAYAAACACRFCSFCSFLCLSRSQYARSASLCCCSATSRLCASTSRWSSYCSLWFRFSLSRQSLFLSIIRLSRSFSNAAILLFCVSISLWRDFMILSDLQFRKSRVRWSITSWQRFSSAKIRSIASSTLLISLSFLSNSRR